MIRFGLCCLFSDQPIKFRQVTAKILLQGPRAEQLKKLSEICLHNVQSVFKAIEFCAEHGIGAFRVMTPLFPRYTHPRVGYCLDELQDLSEISKLFEKIRTYRHEKNIRLSLHPDQFNVLSSPRADVVEKTILELTYQGELAELLGAECINLHAGGAYGDKKSALLRLEDTFWRLPENVQKRLTLENDDISYTPADLLPVCRKLEIPMVYDVHHHRCLPDGLSEDQVTRAISELWISIKREPYFHISSPKNGWGSKNPKPHADYIDVKDFPDCWCGLDATVDVEAKAKELAVLRLKDELKQ